jgi:Peptidase family M1 domain
MKASEVGFTITNMNPHMYVNENFSIIFYTRNLHFKNTKFASNEIAKIIDIIERYIDMKFPHKKLKYVTVPNSDLSLTEITSEMHILIDKNFTTFSENYVHEQLSVQIAQLWIHNFVNYKTREHFWLHDALGLYLQTISLYELNKTSQADHLILEDRLNGMRDELNYKSTSLSFFNQYHVDDPDYHNFIKRKGASILRMFNSTISEPVLRNAIQKYVQKM